ncbi:MAG: hypothetical protein QW385_08730 [Thermoproteota archaeon]
MTKILPEVKRKKLEDINAIAMLGIWLAFPTILVFIGIFSSMYRLR